MDETRLDNCSYVSSDSESWMVNNDMCPEDFSKQLICYEDSVLNYTSNYDFVINEAANNPSSLETIVEETSDDLRSESSDNVELSEYNNSLDSWIDSELENFSLKEEDEIGNVRTPKSVSDCCVQHSIIEASGNNTEFDSNYISRSNSLVQFENLEKLYEDYCPNLKSVIDNNSTSLPNFCSSFGVSSQDSLEVIRNSRNFLQKQLSANSISSKSRISRSVNSNAFKSYSDDDIGFESGISNTSKTKSKKTSLGKSKKTSNENLSEDSGFFSDHAVSKKVSCQFQPYDKEDLFIFNRNFASANFGNSCQNLTMLSDREPATKLFQQRNSLNNKFSSRNHSNKFSFSLHDTISEDYFSGGEENEKSQTETDVLSLDANETVWTSITPTPITVPIRSVNSEPNICLKFNKLIENRSDSNYFIDFSEFLIDSTKRKTKLNKGCKFSKSDDSVYINYRKCENLQTNMSSNCDLDQKNANNSPSLTLQKTTITVSNEEQKHPPEIVFNAVNNNDGLPFRLLQNDEHFPIPTTRRNVKSTSNLTEFVLIANAQNEYSSTNSINTATKSVHFCPIVSQVQLHDDIDHVDRTLNDKDQAIHNNSLPNDLDFGENKRNSCYDIIYSTNEKIDGNRTGKHEGLNQHSITVDNKQHNTLVDDERIPILLPINSQQPNRKVSSQVIENYKLMPVAEMVNERSPRKRFGGFFTRLTSFRFKKRQSQHKQQLKQNTANSKALQLRTCSANTYDVVGRRISGDNSGNSDEFLYIPLKNEPIDNNKNHNHHNNNHHHHYTENDEKGVKQQQIKGKPPLPVRIVSSCVKKKQQSQEKNTDNGCTMPGLLLSSSTATPGSVHHGKIIDRERQQQQQQQKQKNFQLSDLDNNANCNISLMDHYANENYLENGTHVEDNAHPQILGLIETDLDTDVTVITSNSGTTHVKTRSLMNLGLDQNHLLVRSVDQSDFTNSDRPHKSMEFLLDKDNLKSIEPPENELQKVTNNGDRTMSEHQLRVQRSLQKLTLPEWYKPSQVPTQGFLLRRKYHHQQQKEQTRLKSKEVPNGEYQRDADSHNRTKLNLPDGNNQLYFSRWSTPKLNSSYTSASSPCHSIRSSFSYHYQNRSSNNSMSYNQTFSGFSSSARSSFNDRKPYLGWRSQERLNQTNKMPRTPAERLALSLYPSEKQNELIDTPNQNDIQSSIKEVTSAIVNYCGLPDRRQSQSSNSSLKGSKQFCWLESSFIGSKANLGVPNNYLVDSDNDNLSNLSNNLDEINAKIDFISDETSMTKTQTVSSAASTAIPLNDEDFKKHLNLKINETRQSIGSTTLDDIIGSLLGLKTNCSSTNK